MANRVNVDLDMNVQGYVQGMNKATQSTAEYQTETTKVKDSTMNFRKELVSARRDALNLTASYRMLSQEAKNSQFGKEMKRQMEEAQAKASQLIDINKDLRTQLNNMASDTKALDTLSESMGILGHTTSSVMGIIAQFTGNEEDARKAVVAFTTATSILTTLTKIQTAMQAQSNTMMMVSAVQTKAAAAAQKMKTAAEGEGIVVTNAATVAQAAFNAVADANPYLLIASAIGLVIAALTAFITLSGQSSEAEEREAHIAERAANVHKAYYDTINSELEKTVPKFIKLKTEWANLHTEAEKTEWIKKNQEEFKSLSVKIDDVTDAENFLERNTSKVMDAFIKRAQAIAIAQKAAEIYKQALDDITWLEEQRGSKSFTGDELREHGFDTENVRVDHHGGFLGLGRFRYEITDYEAQIKRRQNAAIDAMTKLYEEMGRLTTEGEGKLADIGIAASEEGTKKVENKRKNNAARTKREIAKNSLEEAEELVKTWQLALSKADINDQPLIDKINERLKAAEQEVRNRKIILGIEVTAEELPSKIKDWEKRQKEIELKLAADIPQEEKDKLYEELKELKKNIEQEKIKSHLIIDPQIKIKEDAEKRLQEIMNKLMKPEKIQYDFTALKQDDQKQANNAVSELERQKAAIDEIEKIIASLREQGLGEEIIQPFNDALQGLIPMYESLIEEVNKFTEANRQAAEQQKELQKLVQTFNDIGKATQAAGQMFSALGAATDEVSLKAVSLIAQAVATIALSYANALNSASKNWVTWLAFGISGLATMTQMISQIKSLTAGSYANGGVVGGHSYYGDKLIARVNSGETILTEKQAKNVNDQLDAKKVNGVGQIQLGIVGQIRGTDILLVAKNTSQVMKRAGNSINF